MGTSAHPNWRAKRRVYSLTTARSTFFGIDGFSDPLTATLSQCGDVSAAGGSDALSAKRATDRPHPVSFRPLGYPLKLCQHPSCSLLGQFADSLDTRSLTIPRRLSCCTPRKRQRALPLLALRKSEA